VRIQQYLFLETIEACLKELEGFSGKAQVIAGGTDLVPAIQRGERHPVALLDITRIPALGGIVEKKGQVRLGARVTHADCASSPLVQKWATCLAEACVAVGSPQIRHIATVAGNVVNAQPAADGAIALTALGARARIISTQGEREARIEDLYRGPGESRIDSSRELLTDLYFPATKTGEGTAFLRVAPRNAMGLPVLNGAVWVSLRDDKVADIRIALGPVSDRPFRPQGAEALLKGSRPDHPTVLEEAARVASEEANPRDSLLRGSAAYRREMIKTLMKNLFKTAIDRARNSRSGS
jgi:CO/xanthine dehydrogenase FAD-binding subunit